MYKILYITLVIITISFSCKSLSFAKEKKINQTTPLPKKEKQTTPAPSQLSPNAIQLTAEIYDILSDFNVCNRNYKKAILIKIKIVSNGFAVVNPLSTGQEITLGIHKSLLEGLNQEPEKLKVKHHVSVIVRERLCLDTNIPSYEITSILSK
ncbi:hypothetical protein ABW636_13695 [Aquimarina sp. 2201CG1-2-11]|uniref:hypothetical protein n=1 Tax=Aquimarina discodermiae TaxID=3231043 RepID=UPI003462316E